jgi:excisionase family DNA binding protein
VKWTARQIRIKSGRTRPGEQVSDAVEKFLFTREEAAYSLGISKRSIDYLIQAKKLETRRIGTKVLVIRESLRQYKRGNHPEAIRPPKDAQKQCDLLKIA